MSSRHVQLLGSLVAAALIVVFTLLLVGARLPGITDRLPEVVEVHEDDREEREEEAEEQREEREEAREEQRERREETDEEQRE